MADFGTDIDFQNGLNPLLVLVSGTTNLGQALVHRLSTPRLSLWYDPDYGTDLRAYLNETLNNAKLAQARTDAQAECLKDERVLSCLATTTFDRRTKTMGVSVTGQTKEGPFTLVLAVTDLTVELLQFTAPTL